MTPPCGCSRYADEIRACETLEQLRKVHDTHVPTRYTSNLLVHMYGKLGSVDEARSVFEATPAKNVYSWNIVMAAFAHNGQYRQSLRFRHAMDNDGTKPDNYTFVSMLSSCAALRDIALGRALHERVVAMGLESHPLVTNVLIFMYGKCGEHEKAMVLFSQGQHHCSIDSWNSIISGYAHSGHVEKAMELFERMRKSGILPNKITFACILDGCAAERMLDRGILLHRDVVECGLERDAVVATALVTMYGRHSRIDLARQVFDGYENQNTFMWNAMISAYAQNGHYIEALDLYRCPIRACVADEITFLSVLEACSGLREFQIGREVHTAITERGLDSSETISSALVTMYANCGSLRDAKLVFNCVQCKNVALWNALLAAHSNNGSCRETLHLWRRMDLEGVRSNVVTLITIANACSKLGDLQQGKRAHERVMSEGLDRDLITCNGLITMYAYCNDVLAAKRVFESMKHRNVVSWSAMMAANAQNGLCKEALDVYLEMNVKPDCVCFLTVLDACSRMQNLEMGKRVHCSIVRLGMEADVSLGNALINMYSRCSSLQDALSVFEKMKKRNAASWTAIVAAYTYSGHSKEALEFYEASIEQGIQADSTMLAIALDASSSLGDLEKGRKIHLSAAANSTDLLDASVGNALFSMYGKCGSIEDAEGAFHRMETKNIVSWNAMISTYARHGHGTKAVACFRRLDLEGYTPNETTFNAVLMACSHTGLVEEGWFYFTYMTVDLGIPVDTQLRGCMLDLLFRIGQVYEARELMRYVSNGISLMHKTGTALKVEKT